jgi:hypothetical protein
MLHDTFYCRDIALHSAFQKRGVLLTSYGMVLHNAEALAAPPGRLRAEEGTGALWDFMFLDEVLLPPQIA